MSDAWLLAVGTLTAIPVRPPTDWLPATTVNGRWS